MDFSPLPRQAAFAEQPVQPASQPDPLRKVAEQLEASFLAEMLKSAGLGKVENGFDGGAGEDQFASLLVDQQALQMVRAGGIGLSEIIYEQLKERENDKI